MLGAKRGLEQYPNHYGEMRGRSRIQEERLESVWAWASAYIYTPQALEQIQKPAHASGSCVKRLALMKSLGTEEMLSTVKDSYRYQD